MKVSARSFVALAMVSVIVVACDSDPAALPLRDGPSPTVRVASSVGVNDGQGKSWRQLTETTGLSWTDVAQVCPRDGATPCDGIVGGRDLRGWIWATSDQVTALLALFEPDILTLPTVSGPQYFFTAENFFGFLRPTFSFALTYQAGQNAAGWTASTDADGAPIAAGVGNGHNMVSIGGSFSVSAVADPNEVSSSRGVFLWHAAGSGVVDAVNDAGNANPGGGAAVANVLANDLFAGSQATLGLLTISQLSTSDANVTLDPATGSVNVAAGVSVGVKKVDYSLCETASATNCDIATVTVTVVPFVVDAVNDAGSATSTAGGTAVADVLANDRFNGGPATAQNVNLAFVSSTNSGVTLDTSDGSVDVAPGTTGGAQTLVYSICEIASPLNCDQANVTVNVSPQTILVSPAKFTVKEGGSGSFTVRLSQQPSADVVVSVGYSEGTGSVTAQPGTITFTPANWNIGSVVTFQVAQDADQDNNGAAILLSAPGLATAVVPVSIIDDDQPAGYPVAMLDAPLNGQTVSGLVTFTGTGTDSNGQVVEARFSVDGNRIYKNTRAGATLRVSGGWNTLSVPNGWHTLELRVTDNTGNDGRMLVKVFVSN